jgi:hypothetical protein
MIGDGRFAKRRPTRWIVTIKAISARKVMSPFCD